MDLVSTKSLPSQVIQAIETTQDQLRFIPNAPKEVAAYLYEFDHCTTLLRHLEEQASEDPTITGNHQTEVYLEDILASIFEFQDLLDKLENAFGARQTGLRPWPSPLPILMRSRLSNFLRKLRVLNANMTMWFHEVYL
jgi:hypothetical protein